MSLWNKRLSKIDFTDLDEFCKAGYTEGVQLDYKREIPKDLAKLAAAFANTRGGLILLGVEADTTTNKPKDWPCKGMESKSGISEQIMQICRDAIYPPIMPEISPVIDDPNNAKRVFMVVRVDESPQAPHSIQNSTKVYIRTRDANHPIELADLGRIAFLIERRKEPNAFREQLLSRQLNRMERRMIQSPLSTAPIVWWSILPEFPHQHLCRLDTCKSALFGNSSYQRVQDGYWDLRSGNGLLNNTSKDKTISGSTCFGDLFHAHLFHLNTHRTMPGPTIAKKTLQFINHSREFYSRDNVVYPGLLRLTVGCERVADLAMKTFGPEGIEPRCPDATLRLERTIRMEETSSKQSCESLAFVVVEELFHCFGRSRPPSVQEWK